MNNGWIGFDLDGTLAIYTNWQGIEHIGEPIANTVAIVKKLLMTGQKVKILTARVCSMQTNTDIMLATKAIKAWCLEHIGQELEVTAEKDWNLIELYDDRCITVEYNTGRIVERRFV